MYYFSSVVCDGCKQMTERAVMPVVTTEADDEVSNVYLKVSVV